MTNRQIFFILDTPYGGGDLLASGLRYHKPQMPVSSETGVTPVGSHSTINSSKAEQQLIEFCQNFSENYDLSPAEPRPIDHTEFEGSKFDHERLSARKILLSIEEDHYPLILHHTALIFMMPFWRLVLEDIPINARFILVNSNPLLVSERLFDHHQISPQLALALWSQGMIHAIEGRREEDILISYHHLIHDPQIQLQNLADLLGLEGHDKTIKDKGAALLKARQKNDLAHTARDITHHRDIPNPVKNIFANLENLARDNSKENQKDYRKAAEYFLSHASELKFYLDALTQLDKERVALSASNTVVQSTIANLEEQKLNLEENINALELKNKTLFEGEKQKSEKLSALDEELSKLRYGNDETIGRLTEKNESLQRQIKDNETTINSLQRLVEKVRHEQEKKLHEAQIENAALTQNLKDNETLIEEIRKNRNHDRHRYNLERATLIKQHKREKDDLQDLFDAFIRPPLIDEDEDEQDQFEDDINEPIETILDAQNLIDDNEHSLVDDDASSLAGDVTPSKKNKKQNYDQQGQQALLEALEAAQSELQAAHEMQASQSANLQQVENQLQTSQQALLDQEATIAEYRLEAESAVEDLRALRNSTSWKISAPVRGVKTTITNPKRAFKGGAKKTGNLIWKLLPLPRRSKSILSKTIITTFPFLSSSSKNQNHALGDTNDENNLTKQGDLSLDDPVQDEQVQDIVLNSAQSSLSAEPPLLSELDTFVPLTATKPPDEKKARAIAFYLPQFHQIPENDQWWGEGFTEWDNVKPATPQFDGHYQPHIPGELGYYDLDKDDNILRRQTELAASHGLEGFAFYFYWFNGKRLLEKPLQKYLNDKSITFPYCLCWANENWSRRWDGEDHEMLITQNHSPADDIAFISHLAQYLKDPRYIRIDGKPLIMVYRPGVLPSPVETTNRWRIWCKENDIGDIYLAYSQSFDKTTPVTIGFDAAIEFPPNNHGLVGSPSLINGANKDFTGKVFDWRDLVKRSHTYPQLPYKLFRGVNPSWDNTPRRKTDSTVLLHSAPSLYHQWLSNAVADTQKRFDTQDERLIFINAWNEWAEGAHLEPDERYGYAWLEATRRALTQNDTSPGDINIPMIVNEYTGLERNDIIAPKKKRIIIVTHDLYRHGAQFLSLNFTRTLSQKFGFDVHVIAGEDGPLKSHFIQSAETQFGGVSVLTKNTPPHEIQARLNQLRQAGYTHALINSSASGWLSHYFSDSGIKFLGLVHELPAIIKDMGLEDNLSAFDTYSEHVIFPSQKVADATGHLLPAQAWKKPTILAQGLYKNEGINDITDKEHAREKLKKHHNLPSNALVILGVGFADHRKGIDIFIRWAIASIQSHPYAHFIWIGEIASDMRDKVNELLDSAPSAKTQIHLPGFIAQTKDYYHGADIYALSSREDPFPSTVLEALSAATPTIMVSGTGGIEDLAIYDCVTAIPQDNNEAFISALTRWGAREKRLQIGQQGAALIREKFGFVSYVAKLLEQLNGPWQGHHRSLGVSAIVPNYNYEHYLEKRLGSLINQTLPPREIIFLDDASTDNSVARAREILGKSGIAHKIIRNETNSGNVFDQWRKGVELASYSLIWMAEADDWADPRFIEIMSQKFTNDNIVLAYSESRQIDVEGNIIAPNYLYYVQDISPEKWNSSFIGDGAHEIAEGLAVKNTIPNASAVLFKSDALQKLLHQDKDFSNRFRTAGDWYIYVNLLRHGALAFDQQALNYHRRHNDSVTISKFDLDDLREIARMQHYITREFNIPVSMQQKAKSYLTHLIDHFNLSERYGPDELNNAITPPQ